MDLIYKNRLFERLLMLFNAVVTIAVIASALLQLGFYQPVFSAGNFSIILACATAFFITEKVLRLFNARSRKDFLRSIWFESLFILALIALLYYSEPTVAMSIYLLLQVITKICRSLVNLAASGRNPATALIGSFCILIICGTVSLMLPRSYTVTPVGFVDALFTATSAACVTGLVVKDTGADFSMVGQTVIMVLIQLGGLGIVIFGAVFALLFGQALNVRQSVAMQDLLNARTLGKISRVIAFIFISTITIEAIGAVAMMGLWTPTGSLAESANHKWFYSIFHSVSAFCNAGFALYSDSFTSFSANWRIYAVISPLIIIGGLGFGVLHNIFRVIADLAKRFLRRQRCPKQLFYPAPVTRLSLQAKIVLLTSAILIITGAVFFLILEHHTGSKDISIAGAFFQSITARTAGFNTVDVKSLSPFSKRILMLLMFIGGSPGSTAGGIKTVTLAIIIMAVYAAVRKRAEVEIFKRSIPLVIVGKAITVVLLFATVLFVSSFLLTITERDQGFANSDIMFEASSALGTVGLSCGITPYLSTAGKIIIIITMLIGRLGPLTLLALLTFNIKPAKFNYPTEAVIVG